ncbi:helix-turn-helix domain-containing protein [Afipia carboxidovorans]|nr:helix-turn-helix domain-containing protein [Afipia carboxidovorans]
MSKAFGGLRERKIQMSQSLLSRLSDDFLGRCLNCQARPLNVCAAFDPDELHAMERLGPETHFTSKQALFSEDEPARHVLNLTRGVVRLYKLLPDGRRHIVGFALPGDFLGATFSDRYDYSADALTTVSACRFPRDEFLKFVETKPNILRRMNELDGRELHLARNQMLLLGSCKAEQKVALFLIGWRERLARLGEIPDILPLPMKRRDIADFLGMTIETVSRTLTKLERKKVISNVPKGIRLLNLPRLEDLVWER